VTISADRNQLLK